MDRISWSDKAISFRDLIDNPAIRKPALGKEEHTHTHVFLWEKEVCLFIFKYKLEVKQ